MKNFFLMMTVGILACGCQMEEHKHEHRNEQRENEVKPVKPQQPPVNQRTQRTGS